MSDEKLRTIGVRTGIRHRQSTGAIVAKVRMEFVLKRISRSPRSISSRIPALDHKIANDAMKNETVIETAIGKFLEISDCFRSFIGEQFKFNRSAWGLNRCDFCHFKKFLYKHRNPTVFYEKSRRLSFHCILTEAIIKGNSIRNCRLKISSVRSETFYNPH